MELQQQLDALAARVAALEKRPLPAPFRAEEFGISATAPGYDPTCEGSAYRPAAAPAPGSDAEHPPLGYRLVEPESDKLIKKGWLVWSYGTGPWSEFTPQSIGLYRSASGYAVAEPIPAAEGDSQACAECAKFRAIAQFETTAKEEALVRAEMAERQLAELRTDLDDTKRLLSESIVERDRIRSREDARKVRLEGFRDILRKRLGDLV